MTDRADHPDHLCGQHGRDGRCLFSLWRTHLPKPTKPPKECAGRWREVLSVLARLSGRQGGQPAHRLGASGIRWFWIHGQHQSAMAETHKSMERELGGIANKHSEQTLASTTTPTVTKRRLRRQIKRKLREAAGMIDEYHRLSVGPASIYGENVSSYELRRVASELRRDLLVSSLPQQLCEFQKHLPAVS